MLWRRKRKVTLQTGDLRFVLPNGAVWDCDLTVVKLACENLERNLKLQRVGDRIEANEAFLDLLTAELKSLGCVDCTPSLARQIWIASADQFSKMESQFQSQIRKL